MTTAETEAVVRAAAAQIGRDGSGLELLRDGSNTLFRLGDGVVARVGRHGTAGRARREVEVARWLSRAGIDVVQPIHEAEQPTMVGDRPVTWWEELPASRPSTPAELGAALRRLHSTPPPTGLHLRDLDPFAGFPDRIATSGQVAESDRAWLAGHLERLRQAWPLLPPGLPAGVIHGDAWQDNVVVTGVSVLLDLEHVAIGPPEWDLVHMGADHADFARITEDDYRSFVNGYGGYDVAAWPGFRTMADVVELRWVCFALGRAELDQGAAAEVRHRIACLRGEIPRPWTWHAL